MSDAVSPKLFATLVPLNTLKSESQAMLAKKASVMALPAGHTLFRAGEEVASAYFVLQGAVQLKDADGRVLATVRAGEPAAAHRLPQQAAQKLTASIIEAAHILCIDASLLDVMLTWDQTGTFQVDELSTEDASGNDWMVRLLQMPTFQSVPPANLQAMFMRMQEVDYPAGHIVLKQGEPGDYFYVVMEGRCVVTREVPNQKPVRLAELEIGACFGEEALISESPRNATVTLLTYGKLMRLSKADFRQLLNEPLARKISFAEAKKRVEAGQAQWLDVRMPSEVAAAPLAGAINIPLFMLRMKLAQLDTKTHYIAVCDSGRRSSVAVFVLSQKGYDASMVAGGIPHP